MENLANLISNYPFVADLTGYVTPQELMAAFIHGNDEYESEVMSYSGRYMYGKECLAIKGPEEELKTIIQGLLIVGSAYAYITGNLSVIWDLQECLDSMKSDNLGYDKVYYFPSTNYESEEVSEEEIEVDDEE